jgi:PleD family two-component response regulator
MRNADQALYQAKATGKNRTVSFGGDSQKAA